jgi:hypothetical protein
VHARVVVAAVLLALVAAGVAEAPPHVQVAHARAPVAVVAAPIGEPRLVALGGIEEARRFARRRGGTLGFAVAVPGRRIRGMNINHRFYSASVVKAMLALAVVRAAPRRDLTVGERALLRIARAAGMTRFDVGFNWADALLTAHDQARLFLRIDRLAPRRHRAYLRELLGSIVSWQRWGIAPVAEERGFHVMFKGGWRIGIFHQVALLERDDTRVALAVLTSGTDHGYGRKTQAGIAARVLSRPVSRPAAGGA